MEWALDWAWWPSAQDGPWEWRWRAYPGVWLVAAVPALASLAWLLRSGWASIGDLRAHRGVRLLGAFAVLWAALDWPLGGLAASELLTARTAQYMAVTLIAAPLLLLGLPPSPFEGRRRERLLSPLRRPAVGALAFALVLFATHFEPVVEAGAASPAGAAATAAAWLLAAVVFWWPLAGPGPEAKRMPYLGGLVYLVLPFLLPKVPGVIFVFSEQPMYPTFADPSRAAALSPATDQQLAGFLYWIIGSGMVLAALGVLFFRWYREDRRMMSRGSLELPADPRAVALLFEAPGAWWAIEELLRTIEEALPPGRRGAEVAFAYRPGARGTQVVLELRVAGRPEDEGALAEHIEQEFALVLAGLDPARREAVADRLAFRLVTYGSRVV